MRSSQAIPSGAGYRLALPFPVMVIAYAQTRGAAAPAGTAVPAAPPAGAGAGGGWLFFGLLLGLFVIVGVTVKIYDRWRKRNDEGVRVQARIADALLLEPPLVNLPVAATAHAPFWGGSPMAIEVRGRVPSRELHDRVIDLATKESQATGVDFRIEDHLVVDPALATRRAA